MAKAIIIGSGVAGLSAGCFLQMNGYETEIFEINSIAGGLCAYWERKGYHIDGCIHWWDCTSVNDSIYPTLDALFDLKNLPKVTFEEFASVEEDGKILRFFSDLDLLEKELKTISEEDSKIIEEMIAGAREIVSKYMLLEAEEELYKWKVSWMMPIKEYSKKFKSSLIKKLLIIFPFSPDSSMFEFLLHAARLHNKDACYPLGGAQELMDRLIKRYTSLGGIINYNSGVKHILTENDTAKGIHLESGENYFADYIISAADGYNTVRNMLKGQYIDENVKKLYYSSMVPRKSQIYVSLGLNKTFESSFKPYVFINLKNPLIIEDEKIDTAGITIHNFDPTSAPIGKTVITILIPTSYSESWADLRKKNKAEYERKKEKVALHMIEEIDAYFGGIKEKVEMIDVATPATYVRYTNNWNGGAPMNWGTDGRLFANKPKKEIKGLNKFFMCGQWVGDAGLSYGMQSGRDVAKLICEKEGKNFKVIYKNKPNKSTITTINGTEKELV